MTENLQTQKSSFKENSKKVIQHRWFKRSIWILFSLFLISIISAELYLSSIQPDNVLLASPVKGEPINVLLIGTDAGLLAGGGTMPSRSDVLMLFSFDPVTKKTMMVSVPRDTLVFLDGIGYNRINASHVFGGTAMVLSEVEELLQIPIHYYAKINFKGFSTLIDAIGGVPHLVEMDMDYEDPYDVPPLLIHLKEGFQNLNGDKAEQYVRFRNETGDIGRVERQQKFIASLIRRVLTPTVWFRAPLVAIQMKDYLETNMHLSHGISLVAKFVTSKETYEVTLPGYGEYINGAAYWVPNGFSLQNLWEQQKNK